MATIAEYLQRGESLDYTNATDTLIPDGAVVAVGNHIGVTGCPIPPGKTGSLHMVGVFEIAKTGSTAIEMGATVYFDGPGITAAADNGKSGSEKAAYPTAGYAAGPAAAGDATILVKLCG